MGTFNILFLISVLQLTLTEKLQPRIIGGIDATIQEFPSMAYLEVQTPSWPGKVVSFCGATILSEKTILTAAHCVDQEFSKLTVYVGADKIDELKQQEGYRVYKEVIHPQYDSVTKRNDVAVLKIEPLKPGKWKPVQLAENCDIPTDKALVATGWGSTRRHFILTDRICSEHHSNQLLKVNLRLQYDCQSYFSSYNLDKRLCTGTEDKQLCHGDLGGPLFVDGVQHGIANDVSSNYFQSCTGRTLFTKIADYEKWIRETAAKLDDKPQEEEKPGAEAKSNEEEKPVEENIEEENSEEEKPRKCPKIDEKKKNQRKRNFLKTDDDEKNI